MMSFKALPPPPSPPMIPSSPLLEVLLWLVEEEVRLGLAVVSSRVCLLPSWCGLRQHSTAARFSRFRRGTTKDNWRGGGGHLVAALWFVVLCVAGWADRPFTDSPSAAGSSSTVTPHKQCQPTAKVPIPCMILVALVRRRNEGCWRWCRVLHLHRASSSVVRRP